MKLFEVISVILLIKTCEGKINDGNCGTLHYIPDVQNGTYDRGYIGWVVNLFRMVDDKPQDIHCVATIVSDRWLLTAASCLPTPADNYRIYLSKDTDSSKHFLIDKIIKYPRYNPTVGAGYDMALIKLRTQLAFNFDPVKPICLVKSETDPTWDQSSCMLLYNSRTDAYNEFSAGEISLAKTCKDTFGKFYNGKYMYCGSGRLCSTNNGAPIVCKSDGIYYLAAMASWKQTPIDSCGDKDYINSVVDAYTKLYYPDYFDWIDETAK